MARDQSAKGRAVRLDLDGYKRPSLLTRARPVVTVLACLAAVTWSVLAGRPGGAEQSMHRPGPVSTAHAALSENCAACHDGGSASAGASAGWFNRGVSDAACLKCHEAPVHHPNQKDLRSGMSSASCASCHTEHRGRPALAALDDANCLRCHDNLNGRTLSPAPTVAASVTSFAGNHPEFGRSLLVDGVRKDPSHLRFDHKKHFDLYPTLTDSCTACHSVAEDSTRIALRSDGAAGIAGASASTPSSASGNPGDMAEAASRNYMSPVRYDQHCKSCHELKLEGGVTLAHDRLEVVRSQLDGLAALYVGVLNADPNRASLMEEALSKQKPIKDKAPLNAQASWVNQQFKSLRKAINDQPGEFEVGRTAVSERLNAERAEQVEAATNQLEAEKASVITPQSKPDVLKRYEELTARLARDLKEVSQGDSVPAFVAGQKVNQPHPKLLEYWVVAGMKNSCVTCHDVGGEILPGIVLPKPPVPLAVAPDPSQPGATQETPVALYEVLDAPAGTVLDTVPTGMSGGARRWFTNSRFDHRAHRNLACLDCHPQALQSSKTSDLLLPSRASCTSCHHGGTNSAATACVTCHDFHLSGREVWPQGHAKIAAQPGTSRPTVRATLPQPASDRSPDPAPTAAP